MGFDRQQRIWTNWAGNQRCAPSDVLTPRTEDDLVAAVRRAQRDDRRVKVVGGGHSFTGIAVSDGLLLDPSSYQQVIDVDMATKRVRVQSGIPLHRLNRELEARGLALENLGDIDRQTIAGATATATHGTGTRFGNISSRIVGMSLVDGNGDVHELTEGDTPELLDAARVNIGALGLVSTVTLQCVDAFNLHAVERPMRLTDVLDDLDEHLDGSDHFEFFWVPHTPWALTKTNTRTRDPIAPRGEWTAFRNDLLYANLAHGLAAFAGRFLPERIPKFTRMVPGAGRVEYTDVSHKVFCTPRHVRFYEMEYAIPRAAGREVMERLVDFVRDTGLMISFPVEFRAVAPDTSPLSTAHGRDTVYIAVHLAKGEQVDQYFSGFETICNDYGGRPHWGKMHFQTADTLASRYPEWATFQDARRRFDPAGRFANAYLDRVLGPAH